MNIDQQIQANVDLVIRTLGPESGVDFGLNPESLTYVEGFIERQRVQIDDPDRIDRLVSVLGSFLGACIIAHYGGQWRETDSGLAVALKGGNYAYPFNKVHKQFNNGLKGGDSIAAFFRDIPVLLAPRDEKGKNTG
jgi:hypothetical protein